MNQDHRSLDQLVTAVVVTYNSAACLAGLARGLRDVAVIVVDNASPTDIAPVLQAYLPHAQLIRLSRNVGFGAANNVALRQVKTPFALLLNPDCRIETKAIADLLAVAQQWPDYAIFAPHMRDGKGRFKLSYCWSKCLWRSRGPAAQGLCSVGFIAGACMLLNMQRMASIGFFDEDFFLYYEDEDLCQRVFTARAGLMICPQIEATHFERSSVQEGFPWRSEYVRGYHHAQSKLIFERKHGDPQRVPSQRRKLLLLALLAIPLRIAFFSPKHLVRLWGRFRGLWVYPKREQPD